MIYDIADLVDNLILGNLYKDAILPYQLPKGLVKTFRGQ